MGKCDKTSHKTLEAGIAEESGGLEASNTKESGGRPRRKGRKETDTEARQICKMQKAWCLPKSNHNASSCSFTATRSLELRQATRNRRQKAPANGRHTIEFNVVGCPANANLRQNYSCKSKVERSSNSEWLIYSQSTAAL